MSAIVEPTVCAQSTLSVRPCPWHENLFGLVSFFDMVTFDAGRLCTSMMFLSMGQAMGVVKYVGGEDLDFSNVKESKELLEQVAKMCQYCTETSFPMTRKPLARILELSAESAGNSKIRFQVSDYCALLANAMERLRDETESFLFLRVSPERVRFYKEPREGWKEILDKFPDAGTDIEEASICFSVDRYAACVLHCVQMLEVGVMALGRFIGVEDPRPGWTATTNALDKILKKKDSDMTKFESRHLAFLKQMQATVVALKDAWRNKISHTEGRLQVMTADFSPQVAEEIFIASRGFLRRLATDLPSVTT